MRRRATLLAAAFWSAGSWSATGAAAQLVLGAVAAAGCDEVRGAHVGLLLPQRGLVLLATQPFPGARQVGTVEDGHLRAELTGIGVLELTADPGARRGDVWGLHDRTLDVGERRGCFGFGPRRFSDADDLATYLHWFVRQVLDPYPRPAGSPPPPVWLAGRQVAFTVRVAGHQAVELRVTEGSTIAFQPDGVEHRFYFQPFVPASATDRAAVRVSVKAGGFFTAGATREIGFVEIDAAADTELPSDPPLTLRLTAVEAGAVAGG